jgi:hypothetical protein
VPPAATHSHAHSRNTSICAYRTEEQHGRAGRAETQTTGESARIALGASQRASVGEHMRPGHPTDTPSTATAPLDDQRGHPWADSTPARQERSPAVTLRRGVEGVWAPSSRAGGGCTPSDRPYLDRLDPPRCRLGKPTPREAGDTRKPPPAASMGGSQRQLYGRAEMPL